MLSIVVLATGILHGILHLRALLLSTHCLALYLAWAVIVWRANLSDGVLHLLRSDFSVGVEGFDFIYVTYR